jgi:putative acetyltransferase
METELRWAEPDDYDVLGQLMFEAIHSSPSPYSDAERNAWRAEPYGGPDWHARLAKKRVLIAQEDGAAVGFLTIESGGYVDLGYILPRARERGWFRKLFGMIEQEARSMGERRLRTHASLAAEGPFKAMGFDVVEREVVALNGQSLRRAAMEKPLI